MRAPIRFASAFLAIVAALVCAACQTGSEDPIETAASATTAVMCRRSAAECLHSCPDGRYRFLVPDDRCPGEADDPRDTGVCLCGAGELPPPPEKPDGRFIGCRQSPGECNDSCSTRHGLYMDNWPACPELGDREDMRGGCFCR